MYKKLHYPTPIPTQPPAPPLPRLGTWHTISATVSKIHPFVDVELGQRNCTEWQRRECEPVDMMFIGTRIVREGAMVDTEMLISDPIDGSPVDIVYDRSFQPRRFIHVWLFVKSPHAKPVYVLPTDAVELVKESE